MKHPFELTTAIVWDDANNNNNKMKGTFELTTATVGQDVNRGYSAIAPQVCVCYSAAVPQVQILFSVTFELTTAKGWVDVRKGKMKQSFELTAAILEDDAIYARDEVPRHSHRTCHAAYVNDAGPVPKSAASRQLHLVSFNYFISAGPAASWSVSSHMIHLHNGTRMKGQTMRSWRMMKRVGQSRRFLQRRTKKKVGQS